MSTATLDPSSTDASGPAPKPLTTGKQPVGILIALWAFVTVPFAALLVAIPSLWGWGLSWVDAALFVVFYAIGCAGIGVGFHRYFTHGSFKAKRGLRIALAIMGSYAIEGAATHWMTAPSIA